MSPPDLFTAPPHQIVRQIVSGGQTGVDQAALVVAVELGLPHGGWVPRGRWTEAGPLDARFQMRECPSPNPARRTYLNLRDSDATLILAPTPLSGGTALTQRLAAALRKPCLRVDPHKASPRALTRVAAWLARHRPAILNVAGPRESSVPGIHAAAVRFLRQLLTPGGMPDVRPGGQTLQQLEPNGVRHAAGIDRPHRADHDSRERISLDAELRPPAPRHPHHPAPDPHAGRRAGRQGGP